MVFTRFRKILGDDVCSLTPEFTDQFCQYSTQCVADCNWVPVDATLNKVNICTNLIDFDSIVDGTNNSTLYDLWGDGIFLSDTNFTVRFNFKVTSVTAGSSTGKYFFIGLFDSDETVNSESTQDHMTFFNWTASGGSDYRFITGNGVTLSSLTGNDILSHAAPAACDNFFVEIRRTSASSSILTLYSDMCYSEIIERLASTNTVSGIVDLRYIGLKNRTTTCTTGSIVGTIDCIEVWNCTEGLTDEIVVKGNTEQTRTFEDLDACISTLKTATVTDDFTTDNFTNIAGTSATVNVNRELFLACASSCIEFHDGEYRDIGGACGIDCCHWVLRFKYNQIRAVNGSDGTANDVFVGFACNTSNADTAQDYFGWRNFTSSGADRFRMTDADGAAPNVTAGCDFCLGPLDFVGCKPAYMEIIRCGSCGIGTIYECPCYKIVLDRVTSTIGAGVTGLRYLKIMTDNTDGTGDSTNDVTIDCLRFYDGVSVANTPTENTVDLCETFATDCWTDNCGIVAVNTCTNVLDWGGTIDNDGARRDLGLCCVSETQWTLRYKLTIDCTGAAGNSQFWFGMDSTTTFDAGSGVRDFLGMRLVSSTTLNDIGIFDGNGVVLDSGSATCFTLDFADGTVWYMEQKRESATLFRLSIFSCPDYIDLLECQTKAISACYVDLRYLKGNALNFGGGSLDGTIDCVKFWQSDNALVHQNTWVSNDCLIFGVDTERKRIEYNTDGGTDDAIAHDLGACMVDNCKWVLRSKVIFTSVASDADENVDLLGLSSLDHTQDFQSGGGEGLFIRRQQQGGCTNRWRMGSVNGGSLAVEGNAITTIVACTPYYLELKRETCDTATMTIYNKSDFTCVHARYHDTNLPNTIDSLRYIKFSGESGTSLMEGSIDCVKFWNATNLTDGIPDFDSGNISWTEVINSGCTFTKIRFNNYDATTCYSNRFSACGGVEDVTTHDDATFVLASNASNAHPTYGCTTIVNLESEEKQGTLHIVNRNTAGAATAPIRTEIVWEWVNSIEKVRCITLFNSDGGCGYDIGTCITIFACTT